MAPSPALSVCCCNTLVADAALLLVVATPLCPSGLDHNYRALTRFRHSVYWQSFGPLPSVCFDPCLLFSAWLRCVSRLAFAAAAPGRRCGGVHPRSPDPPHAWSAWDGGAGHSARRRGPHAHRAFPQRPLPACSHCVGCAHRRPPRRPPPLHCRRCARTLADTVWRRAARGVVQAAPRSPAPPHRDPITCDRSELRLAASNGLPNSSRSAGGRRERRMG